MSKYTNSGYLHEGNDNFYTQGVNSNYSVVVASGRTPAFNAAAGFVNVGNVPSKVFLSSAEQMSVVSTSANDDFSGSHAQLLLIDGLDTNYNQQQEVVQLDGTTPVLTLQGFIRIQFCRVIQCGSGGESNDGIITVTSASTLNLQSQIDIGDSNSSDVSTCIPAGMVGINKGGIYIDISKVSGGTDPLCRIKLIVRQIGANGNPFQFVVLDIQPQGPVGVFIQEAISFEIPEKSDLFLQVNTDQNNTVVTARAITLLRKTS